MALEDFMEGSCEKNVAKECPPNLIFVDASVCSNQLLASFIISPHLKKGIQPVTTMITE